MFGMVLAIGLLVDDAIVVVENVERIMHDEGLASESRHASSRWSRSQGALVGIALVLSAVLLPMAFFSGSTGIIYRQFSITIVSAMALVRADGADLHPGAVRHHAETELGRAQNHGLAGWFNRKFDAARCATATASAM